VVSDARAAEILMHTAPRNGIYLSKAAEQEYMRSLSDAELIAVERYTRDLYTKRCIQQTHHLLTKNTASLSNE
jgi:hypothetical protein